MSNNQKESDGILSRWSRRKRGLEAEQSEDQLAKAAPPDITDEHLEELEANRLAAEGVDLDAVNSETDFSLFLKEGVPEALKRKALSVLWRSNPILANIDGLNDYDEDFANPNLIMKNFTSAYRVGKGYMKEILEDAEVTGEVAESLPEKPLTAAEQETEAFDEQQDIAQSDEFPEANEDNTETELLPESETAREAEPADEHVARPKVSLRKRLELADREA